MEKGHKILKENLIFLQVSLDYVKESSAKLISIYKPNHSEIKSGQDILQRKQLMLEHHQQNQQW